MENYKTRRSAYSFFGSFNFSIFNMNIYIYTHIHAQSRTCVQSKGDAFENSWDDYSWQGDFIVYLFYLKLNQRLLL